MPLVFSFVLPLHLSDGFSGWAILAVIQFLLKLPVRFFFRPCKISRFGYLLPLQVLDPSSWSGSGRGDNSHEHAHQSASVSTHGVHWPFFGSHCGQELPDFILLLARCVFLPAHGFHREEIGCSSACLQFPAWFTPAANSWPSLIFPLIDSFRIEFSCHCQNWIFVLNIASNSQWWFSILVIFAGRFGRSLPSRSRNSALVFTLPSRFGPWSPAHEIDVPVSDCRIL
jgi:hypothetical protein